MQCYSNLVKGETTGAKPIFDIRRDRQPSFLPVYSSSCSDNEMEVDCVNPCNTCELKGRCDQPPAPCRRGCDCKPGFFRDENGFCLPEQQCLANSENQRCPKNAYYLPCVSLPIPTCENPFPEPDYDDECIPGCTCRSGFLKRKDGQCVTPNQCSAKEDPGKGNPAAKCPKDAIFIKCGSPCPPTCDDLQPEPCEEKCTTACYCKPGFLKRKDGVCVRPVDCNPEKKQERPTPKCPKDAIFIECGSPCPPTCENRLPEPCEEKCTKACYCKPGFLLKTDEGKCVKPENCNTSHIPVKYQHKCDSEEQFYECTPSCKNTCKNIHNPGIKCRCGPPGCFCQEGLVKRGDGKCVKPEQCEVLECLRPGEEFQECGSTCPDTCENRGQHSPDNCPHRCNKGCFCRKGLYRSKNGNCVPLKDCDVERYFTPSPKPATITANIEVITVTVPDDCHGCPATAECEAYCKSLGDFVGFCSGKDHRHCRCA